MTARARPSRRRTVCALTAREDVVHRLAQASSVLPLARYSARAWRLRFAESRQDAARRELPCRMLPPCPWGLLGARAGLSWSHRSRDPRRRSVSDMTECTSRQKKDCTLDIVGQTVSISPAQSLEPSHVHASTVLASLARNAFHSAASDSVCHCCAHIDGC